MKTNYSILIADDDLPLLNTQAAMLSRRGYHVFQAANGEEVLSILADQPVDLLLLDLHMPVFDGEQVIDEVSKQYPELPILIFTGEASVDVANRLLKKGIAGYLLKPVEPLDLIARVQDGLQRRRQAILRSEISAELHSLISSLENYKRPSTY